MPAAALPSRVVDLPTPALVVERSIFDANVAAMRSTLPGARLRPHVKAFKSTALARELAAVGHHGFTAATIREVEGLCAAGLGEDVLLANEVLDARRLGVLVADGHRVTLAVDSAETIRAAADGGVTEVVIDVNVGLPRCGCPPEVAGELADAARAAGLEVRGVMGYEGHLMMELDPARKAEKVEASMALLLRAHADVGGELVSAGGTGTYAVNTWATEIQAGSYCLGDTHYGRLDQPFEIALRVEASVIAANAGGWAVADAGLKAFGMDHGLPTWAGGELWFLSDEHATLADPDGRLAVGDRVSILPAHVDPTVALHEQFWVVDGEAVIDRWPIDLRGW